MGHIGHEPSMEEILSSIKRIIAEDGDAPVAAARPRRAARAQAAPPAPEPVDESEILELTEAVPAPQDEAPAPESFRPASRSEAPLAPEPEPMPAEELVSNTTASVSRQALATLSRMIVKPDEGAPDNTLEGLVREMLRPMLKDWLDANLPDIVKSMVAKEIARITSSAL